MDPAHQYKILANPRDLINRIETRLNNNGVAANWLGAKGCDGIKGSAVLFLLTQKQIGPSTAPEPCLLLNKRSQRVLQPGDLCCPGGGVATFDKILWRFMHLPFLPLHKWAQWPLWRFEHREMARRLALSLTTGLREAWEEMRLNPFKVALLGPLPVQQLILFERRIFPLAAWVQPHLRLKPNWEVERIVHVPLRRLLDPGNYGRYRLTFNSGQGKMPRQNDFPCFIHQGGQGNEILWGATFRIAMDFLRLVFGFSLPEMDSVPVIRGDRGKTYLNGSLWELKEFVKEENGYDY